MISLRRFEMDSGHADKVESFLKNAPVKVGAIAKALGVAVKVSSLPLGVSGQIKREGDDQYVIRVNRFEVKERQRFTIAHELAHYLLHRSLIDGSQTGIQDDVLYRSWAPRRIEHEASRLGAEIIMPVYLVRRKYQHLKEENLAQGELIQMMAGEFEVADMTMEIRLSTISGL